MTTIPKGNIMSENAQESILPENEVPPTIKEGKKRTNIKTLLLSTALVLVTAIVIVPIAFAAKSKIY
jgi:hypothetical protein